MADYRIVKKTNGLGAVRWVVQRYYSIYGWQDEPGKMRSLASARRAMKRIERLERRDRANPANTWSTETVD